MKYLLALAIVLSSTTGLLAARQPVSRGGRAVVSHDRMAPVVVHRVLPPYGLGKHVYRGR